MRRPNYGAIETFAWSIAILRARFAFEILSVTCILTDRSFLSIFLSIMADES